MSMTSKTPGDTGSLLDGRTTISVTEAGLVLGIGRSAAYDAVRRGEIPSLRIGRRVLVPVPRLRALIGIEGNG